MNCCGQRRQALKATIVSQAPPKPTSPVRLESIRLGYRGDSSMIVRGSYTGTTYLFGAGGEGLIVDARDVPILLASGQFVRL